MATKNSMTPSGGIFQSHRGGLIGFGRTQYTGRERLEQFGDILMLHVPGARTPVRQEIPRELTGFLSDLAFLRRAQTSQRTQLMPAHIPQRTQLPQPPHQPMHSR